MCFDMIKVIKGSHLVKSKVTFLRSTKNAAGIGRFFKRWNYETVQFCYNVLVSFQIGNIARILMTDLRFLLDKKYVLQISLRGSVKVSRAISKYCTDVANCACKSLSE